MPIYEYECKDCGLKFEMLVRSNEKTPVCPGCSSSNTGRQPSAPSPLKTGAFPFKPTGVHPLANRMASGCGMGGCAGGCSDKK